MELMSSIYSDTATLSWSIEIKNFIRDFLRIKIIKILLPLNLILILLFEFERYDVQTLSNVRSMYSAAIEQSLNCMTLKFVKYFNKNKHKHVKKFQSYGSFYIFVALGTDSRRPTKDRLGFN